MTTQPQQTHHRPPSFAAAKSAPAIAFLVLTTLAAPATVRADAASEAAGAAVYQAQCVGCHGADGSGNTPIGRSLKVQNLSLPEIQAMKSADLAAAIEKGKGKMPPFKGKLNAAQIGQVIDYIRSLAKAK
jgi:mono/diheme cytochrome c family protein